MQPWQRRAVEVACHLRHPRYQREKKSRLKFYASKDDAEKAHVRLREWKPMVGGEDMKIVRFWAAHIVGTKTVAIAER